MSESKSGRPCPYCEGTGVIKRDTVYESKCEFELCDKGRIREPSPKAGQSFQGKTVTPGKFYGSDTPIPEIWAEPEKPSPGAEDRCCDNGNFGEKHECQKQDGKPQPVAPLIPNSGEIAGLKFGLTDPKHLIQIGRIDEPLVGINRDGTVIVYKEGADKEAAKLFYEGLQFEGVTLHKRVAELEAELYVAKKESEGNRAIIKHWIEVVNSLEAELTAANKHMANLETEVELSGDTVYRCLCGYKTLLVWKYFGKPAQELVDENDRLKKKTDRYLYIIKQCVEVMKMHVKGPTLEMAEEALKTNGGV